ncbi:hypothetical protein Bca4012_096478 [Brassica carinata]
MVRTPCCRAELGLKKGAWTPEEDQKLTSYVNRHGEGGWRTLPEKAARGLPGRTDNEIKNYWNTHIKKRLIKKGVDPLTHKSISANLQDIPKKQDINQTIIMSDDGPDHSAKVKKSASGGTHTTITTSATVDSESDKSASSSFAPTSNLLMTANGNATSSPSAFSESSINDRLMYWDKEYNIEFSTFLNDEDFMVLEESCAENNEFMKELTRFLQEDETDNIEMMPVNEHQDSFEDIDNYFA